MSRGISIGDMILNKLCIVKIGELYYHTDKFWTLDRTKAIKMNRDAANDVAKEHPGYMSVVEY